MSDTLVALLDYACAVSTLILRSAVLYFVRWLPLGPRYLPIIYTNFWTYIICFLFSVVLKSRSSKHKRSSRSRLAILVTGWYAPSHKITAAFSFCLNSITLAFALDFVYRAQFLSLGKDVSFSRHGYVDHESARIVIRDLRPSQIFYQVEGALNWVSGPILTPVQEQDYVSIVNLSKLAPNTSYIYRTNTTHSGSFKTSLKHPKKWSLATASCIKPGFPYNPLGSSLRIPGLEYLSNHAIQYPIDMMLFLGDFIYIDLPVRFGSSNQHYRDAYRQIYASPSWSQTLRNMPWLHMYDDHEITNDWAANETGLWTDAMEPYFAYQHGGNPTPVRAGGSYYKFRRGDISLFVMDTRRYRSPEQMEDGPSKTMLGAQQRQDLEDWLATEKGWKIVVSSVPFTRNWRGPESIDSWAGYLWERQRLLEKMWRTTGVVILSGDRHEHATTEFPSPDGSASVIEFSTSPLSQFYQPFERQYKQIEDTDIELFSHPYGVSKFGVLNFDTSSIGNWSLDFDLIVDGKKVWTKHLEFSK